MFEAINSSEVKARLIELLSRVEAGESFTIIGQGEPIADLTPSQSSNHAEARAAIGTLLSAKRHPVSAETLARLKRAGQALSGERRSRKAAGGKMV